MILDPGTHILPDRVESTIVLTSILCWTPKRHLAIRDWVLIPISIVMLLVGILRHHITMLLSGQPKKPQLKAIRESYVLLPSLDKTNEEYASDSKYYFVGF